MKILHAYRNQIFSKSVGVRRSNLVGYRGKMANDSIVQPGCTEPTSLPKEGFKSEVERHLTGKETEL